MKKIAIRTLRSVMLAAIATLIMSGCQNQTDRQTTESQTDACYVRMLDSEMYRNPQAYTLDFETNPKWNYTHGLMLMASRETWEKTGEQKYFDYIKEYYDLMIDQNGNILHNYKMDNYNIDHIKPGINLFDLYEATGDQRYYIALQTLREQLRTHPRTKDSGFWHKNIYPHQLWLDGVYMNTPFYARYGLVFNEPENFDDVVLQITLVEKKTRDEVTGLLFHAYDESRQQAWADTVSGKSSNFWGRAMGWYAMALVDVLDYFPEDHPGRYDIIQVLQRLVEAIIRVQDEETGLWYQVLDQGGRNGNYLEASVSCMFAYTLAKAVNMHLIEPKYQHMAEKAFSGINTYLISSDNEGHISLNQVCGVAGLGGNPYRDGSYEYYINEIIRSNDPKGVGPYILLCLEMEKLQSGI
jgi:unsaturated rhamnogalacturonyl hydrolase